MPAPVISLYSYKGGAGRTVAAANIAALLATEFERRVVLIDADFESAGMGIVLGVHREVARGKHQRYALQDLLSLNAVLTGAKDFMSQYWPQLAFDMGPRLGFNGGRGKLWFIPSRPSHQDDVSLVGNENAEQMLRILSYLEQELRPDFVILDSASGLAGPAVLSLELAHGLVTFMRWTEQFVEGTVDVLLWLRENRDSIGHYFLVPSAVPETRGEKEFEDQLSRQRARLKLEFDSGPRPVQILNDVPESRRLKWKERIFCVEKTLADDDRHVLAAYRNIAEALDKAYGKGR